MKVLIINFGTESHKADIFGPIVGSLVEDLEIEGVEITIFGKLTDNFTTLEQFLELQKYLNSNSIDLVICTDAAKSSLEEYGLLFLSDKGLHPGKGTPKRDKTHSVGDYGVLLGVGPDPLEIHPNDDEVIRLANRATNHIEALIREKLQENYKGKYYHELQK